MSQAYVKSDFDNGITTIEFFHPQSNSLPGKMLEELAVNIKQAGEDRNTKVIILRSGGEKAFCAGASFDELTAIKSEEEGLRFFSGFARIINTMRTCPKFIIGRIQGKCVGGGVGLAAALDYAIAVNGADIKLSELAVGIGPFVVGPAVERKMGVAAFTQLAINAANFYSAGWATQNGLFAENHLTAADMDESVKRIANVLVQSSPEAMAEIKKICWKSAEHWDELLLERAAISGRLVLSEFTKRAIENFKAKK